MAGTGIRVQRRRSMAVFVALVTAVVSLAAATARPARNAKWDPRLAAIARQVEQLRHLRFLHPIPTQFLSDRAFRKEVTSDDHVGSAAKARVRRRDAVSEAELRSLGLVDGAFDLRTTVDDVQGSDVLAFYDSDRKRIVVRGKHLDAEHRVTLAHELTHGLQDQHYDLTKLQDAADTGGADDALTALIEGDATRIEDAYYEQLSAKDQRAVDQAEGAPDPNVPTGGPENPDAVASSGTSFVSAQLDAPYAVGPGMVYVILSTRHRPGLAAAFHTPPDTQLQMLQPSLSATRVRPARVPAPSLAPGAQRRPNGPTDVGAIDLYFLLASRLPAATAIQAADAWGNGRELVSEQDHQICTDLAFTGRDAAGTRRIAAALRAWSAAMPAGAVRLRRGGLLLHVCDPGKTGAAPPTSAGAALEFAATRAFVETDMVRGGIPPGIARCMSDHMVARPDYLRFVTVATSADEPKAADVKQFKNVIGALADGCTG
jgi:hypothetical protein